MNTRMKRREKEKIEKIAVVRYANILWCHDRLYGEWIFLASKQPIFKYNIAGVATICTRNFINCAPNGKIGYCLRFNIRHTKIKRPNVVADILTIYIHAMSTLIDKIGIITMFISSTFCHKMCTLQRILMLYFHWYCYLSCIFFHYTDIQVYLLESRQHSFGLI